VTYPIIKDTRFYRHNFEDLENQGMGKWGFTKDPYEMARMMIGHIDKKRRQLGIDKSKKRVLVDMADRRQLQAH
jgi:carbon-monoxide dehydrogenase catalytic subunit